MNKNNYQKYCNLKDGKVYDLFYTRSHKDTCIFLNTYVFYLSFNSSVGKNKDMEINQRHKLYYFFAIEISIYFSFVKTSLSFSPEDPRNFRSIHPRFRFILHPTIAFRSIGSLTRKKKKKTRKGGGSGRKSVRKKCLRPGNIKSSSTGVTRPRSTLLSAKTLSLSRSSPFLSRSCPLLPPSSLSSSPLSRLFRENPPPPFVKGDPTKSPPTSYTCVQKG